MKLTMYRYTQRILITAVIFLSVFDPANKFFEIKYPLFVALVLVCVPDIFFSRCNSRAKVPVIIFFLIFSLIIPLYGLLVGEISGSMFSLNGWLGYFFAYLYLLLALCIISDVEYATKVFFYALNCLSFLIVGIFVLGHVVNLQNLYEFGNAYGLYVLGSRTYGGTVFNVTYYVTSPLLIMASAYWAYAVAKHVRLASVVMLCVTSAALFLSGTRANMAFAVIVPFVSFLIYRRISWSVAIAVVMALFTLYFNYADIIDSMLSVTSYSISVKFGYLSDYLRIASSTHDFIFGQGLGAYFFATPLGKFVNVTELTYLEIFRMYGVFVGVVVIFMLAIPLKGGVSRLCASKRYLHIGYLFYLMACIVNPYLFSSNGMLILAVVLVNYYLQIRVPVTFREHIPINSSRTSDHSIRSLA